MGGSLTNHDSWEPQERISIRTRIGALDRTIDRSYDWRRRMTGRRTTVMANDVYLFHLRCLEIRAAREEGDANRDG